MPDPVSAKGGLGTEGVHGRTEEPEGHGGGGGEGRQETIRGARRRSYEGMGTRVPEGPQAVRAGEQEAPGLYVLSQKTVRGMAT